MPFWRRTTIRLTFLSIFGTYLWFLWYFFKQTDWQAQEQLVTLNTAALAGCATVMFFLVWMVFRFTGKK